jgi:hypothetical protein
MLLHFRRCLLLILEFFLMDMLVQLQLCFIGQVFFLLEIIQLNSDFPFDLAVAHGLFTFTLLHIDRFVLLNLLIQHG